MTIPTVRAIHELPLQKDLPVGWAWKTVGTVCQIIRGVSYKKEEVREQGRAGYLPILRATNIQDNHLVLNRDLVYVPSSLVTDSQKLRIGDIVVATSSGSKHLVGKSAQVRESWTGSFGVFCAVIRPHSEVEHRYLGYYFDSPDYKDFISSKAIGVNINNLRRGDLEEINVPVAPLNEQKRIVAEIEKQFSRLDEAVSSLKRMQVNLKRYKASVLKAAVKGKLTEEWRKKNLPAPSSVPGKFYTYAVLCEDDSIYIGHTDNIGRRWKEHLEGKGAEWTAEHKPVKIAHYEEYDTRKEAADREKWLKTGFGRKWIKRELAAGRTRQAGRVEPASELLKRILAERKKKWEVEHPGKKYKEPAPPDTSNLPELLKGWVWATIGQIAECLDSMRVPVNKKERAARQGNIPYYGANGQVGWIDKYLFDETLVLVVEDETFTGRELPFSYKISGKSWVNNHAHVLRNSNAVNVDFLNYSLAHYPFTPLTTGTTGRKKLTQAALLSALYKVPPLSEQIEIVNQIESCLSVAEEIEAAVEINLKRAERLRQSILKQAFSGKLVPKTLVKKQQASCLSVLKTRLI